MDEATLLQHIQTLYGELRNQMADKWQRDLPFEELVFDRWERAQQLQFGEDSSIYHNSYVYGDVKVGKNTWIGPMTMLDGTGGLSIGDWCCLSAFVQIYTHDTVRRFVSGGVEPSEYSPVTIENNCYLGPSSIITKGVTIGHHSIIGAGSFVNDNIPPFSIAHGTPARVVGQVSLDAEGKLIFSGKA